MHHGFPMGWSPAHLCTGCGRGLGAFGIDCRRARSHAPRSLAVMALCRSDVARLAGTPCHLPCTPDTLFSNAASSAVLCPVRPAFWTGPCHVLARLAGGLGGSRCRGYFFLTQVALLCACAGLCRGLGWGTGWVVHVAFTHLKGTGAGSERAGAVGIPVRPTMPRLFLMLARPLSPVCS